MSNNTTDEQTGTELVFEIVNQMLLFFLVFGFAATVHYKNLSESFKSKGIILAAVIQFLVMPLVGYLIVTIVPDLDNAAVVVLLIITTSPGGAYSNFYNSVVNGDLSLSVAMTTFSTFLSIAFIPLNLYLYIDVILSSDEETSASELLDWPALIQTVVLLILAVSLGVFSNYKYPRYSNAFNGFANICGIVQIVLTLFASNSGDEALWEKDLNFYIATMIPAIIAVALGIVSSLLLGLSKPSTFAVAIEVSFQNSAIAIAFSFAAFSGDALTEALAVPVLYGVSNVLTGTVLAIYAFFMGWTYTPQGTPIIKALLYNFQPLPEDDLPSAAPEATSEGQKSDPLEGMSEL